MIILMPSVYIYARVGDVPSHKIKDKAVREGYLGLKNISDFLNQSILLVHECVREGYFR